MKHAKPFFAALAALAILALIVRQVTQAVRHTFTPPAGLAQIDRASSRTQNGLTLMEIQNVNPANGYSYSEDGLRLTSQTQPEDETGLWISLNFVPIGMVSPCSANMISSNVHCDQFYSATGRSSTGSTFTLPWQYINDVGNHLLVTLPPGYPDDYRWIDVTVDDHHGGLATWRITHLPPMQHVLIPPLKAQTAFRQGGILAHAAAYSGPDPNGNLKGPVLLCDVAGTVKPSPHQWQLGPMTLTREWEPPGYVPVSSGNSWGTEKKNGAVRFEANGDPVYATQPQPYLSDIHWVRLTAQMQEFETYDEIVTFHNVSVFKLKSGGQYLVGTSPETVTTPSGVTVTLDDVQHRPNLSSSWGGDGYCLHLLYPQTTLQPNLPQSPLWRKYKTAIRVSADIPKPYDSGGSSYGVTDGTYSFRTNKPLPPTLPTFRVIVRQRVDLSSVPMTFTLPVGNKPPKRAL